MYPAARVASLLVQRAWKPSLRADPKARRLLFVCVCGRASEQVIDIAPKAA
jgi:hypothetical protein